MPAESSSAAPLATVDSWPSASEPPVSDRVSSPCTCSERAACTPEPTVTVCTPSGLTITSSSAFGVWPRVQFVPLLQSPEVKSIQRLVTDAAVSVSAPAPAPSVSVTSGMAADSVGTVPVRVPP